MNEWLSPFTLSFYNILSIERLFSRNMVNECFQKVMDLSCVLVILLLRFLTYSYLLAFNVWLLLAPVTLCYDSGQAVFLWWAPYGTYGTELPSFWQLWWPYWKSSLFSSLQGNFLNIQMNTALEEMLYTQKNVGLNWIYPLSKKTLYLKISRKVIYILKTLMGLGGQGYLNYIPYCFYRLCRNWIWNLMFTNENFFSCSWLFFDAIVLFHVMISDINNIVIST